MDFCPCGSQKPYENCCEPFISHTTDVPTAEHLMRARYSAYVKGAISFILDTTLEEKRKECDEKAIRDWSSNSQWHKLEIISTTNGGVEHTEGTVEFIAHFTEFGILKSLHEKGLFKKVNGHWFYVDGEIQKSKPFIRTETKLSRNDPCPCGSGKKLKKCCSKE
jgi:SEC-C motif domain protein